MKRHRRRWPAPKAELVLDMTSRVIHLQPKVYHAEITVAIEVSSKETLYYTIGCSAQTERGALRKAIESMESQFWFRYFRSRGIVFKVFGVLEDVYRGYLA